MTAILVHIGCTGPYIDGTRPPAHLTACIDQYRLFNTGDLHILTDRENLSHLPQRNGVYHHAIEDYHSDKVNRLESLYNFGPREFWTVAVTRFIYMENFLRKNDLRHVYHFENDVLIYFNIREHEHIFKRLYKGLAITPGGPWVSMTGFLYIDSYIALEHMTAFFTETLERLGAKGTMARYGLYGIEEMQLMYAYGVEHGMGKLPILPFGEHSQNFDDFDAIFDPATWGQYVGGTRTAGPGIKPQNHYIGVILNEYPECDVVWSVDSAGRRFPLFHCNAELVKINNLHIHSKNMHLYMSK